jgi:DNA-binding response OmpR family regulator
VLSSLISEIDVAADGRDALAKAIGTRPTVLVAEPMLPFFNADVLCYLLRVDPLTADVRVVVISDGSAEHVEVARASGADRVLISPPAQYFLQHTVTALLARQPAPARRPSWSVAHRPIRQPNPGDEDPRRRTATQRRSQTTTTPPLTPPALRCRGCDRVLRYVASHIAGASDAKQEQWDTFACSACAAAYEYRQRTRAVRRVNSKDVVR